MRQTKLILLLGLLALSGFSAYAYRVSEQWHGHTAAPAGQPAATLSHSRGRHADNPRVTPVTLIRAAAVTHSDVVPKAEDAKPEAAPEPVQSGGSYNITQSVISGGGGTSANGATNVTGTIGQSAATASSGGNYTVSGGFWAGGASTGCPAILVNPTNATLPAGRAGQSYLQTFSASGGTAAYSFSIITGGLPNGLSLSTDGLLSGTPVTFGNFSFTVEATDANSCQGTQAYTLAINPPCPGVTVGPTSLPDGTVGTLYNQTATATGGTPAYTFTISAGMLPGGLTLASDGALTGTPTAPGVFNFTIQATDASGCMGTRGYTVTVTGVVVNNGLQFYPLPRPVRLMDTRPNEGNCDNVGAPINAGTSLTIPARTTCEGIVIPASAKAVVGNLTVINQAPQNAGYLTIYPDGVPAPLASNMIYYPGKIIANNFTVALSGDGKFNVFGERMIDVVIDISGYYAPPGAGGLYYHPLARPVRLLDTRPNEGACDNVSAPIAAGTSITAQARTTCEGLAIPPTAQAIAANATVINQDPQNAGYLTIYPNGVPVPLASNLIYYPGQIISNAFTVSLNGSGEFNIYGQRKIDMIVDVAGYYSADATDANGQGLLFNPLPRPLRILDTRANQGNCDNISTPIVGGTSIAALGRLTCEGITIPTAAQSLLGNATVINQTSQAGYLTLYPDGVQAPLVSNMVYFPGQLLANAFVVGVDANTGQFRIFGERTLDAVVDVSGFFAP